VVYLARDLLQIFAESVGERILKIIRKFGNVMDKNTVSLFVFLIKFALTSYA